MADRNVRSHLAKLENEGRLLVHAGKPRVRSEEELAQEAAERETRQSVVRQAEESREQDRRRGLFLQENPPLEEWQEPPRYELA